MLVGKEGNIYLDKILKKANKWTNSVFVVVPLRLGIDYVLPEYLESIKEVFKLRQNTGIAGGRENSALYFVGLSTDSTHYDLLYLDPHFV